MTDMELRMAFDKSVRALPRTHAYSVFYKGDFNASRDYWNGLVSGKLSSWQTAPAQDDEPTPTKGVILRAIQLAWVLRDQGWRAASLVVPAANGGIVMAWRGAPLSRTIVLAEDGSVDVLTFREGSVIARDRLLETFR